jgi:hypothetical protein
MISHSVSNSDCMSTSGSTFMQQSSVDGDTRVMEATARTPDPVYACEQPHVIRLIDHNPSNTACRYSQTGQCWGLWRG